MTLPDGDALRRAYEKYKGVMVSVAAGMTGDISTAEDIMQEAFVAFARRAAEGAVCQNLKSYLMTCVMNGVRYRFRKMSRHEELVATMELLPAQRLGILDRVVISEDIERLHVAMGQLAEEVREVIVLRIHGQMRFDQIAAVQGSNANTARTRYRRGIERLRELLNE
ncbi:MAG TPA: sigma-70 family RNA polymerase sigma factor [Sedimentisphaerales bacterium]|nr:sigma-70 family RNA polymerase sigma factor [Sedimentisphaerales bacterium]